MSATKPGFTLIEMIIVIGIVSILFLITRGGFQSNNTYTTQAQGCIQYSYGTMQSRLYAGLTQRSIQTQPAGIFPKTYSIKTNISNQSILLGYDEIENFTTIQLNSTNSIGCNNNRYQVIMTGDELNISIENKTMKASQFTGTIDFLFCQEEECRPLGSIYYDTRIQQLRLYICPQGDNSFCSS